jgi:SAM-dependent methyltransferase
VAFWRDWLQTQGGPWADDHRNRLDPERPLQPAVRALVPVGAGGRVRILDVGAGPLTFLGKRWEGRHVDIVAVDALAHDYDRLLAEAGVEPPLRTGRCDTERLTEVFAPGSFDVVCASNTLDHSYDPLRAIGQMVEVTRPGGAVYLKHLQNEAEHERHVGLHQWNLQVEDGRFTVWNADARWDVEVALVGRARIERAETTTGRWHEVVLRA